MNSSEKQVEFIISEILELTNDTPVLSNLFNECGIPVQHCYFSQMGVDIWIDVNNDCSIGECPDERFFLSS